MKRIPLTCATILLRWDQQRETASFGMWLFLLTEIMFFGGLFMAYLLYRNWYYDAFCCQQQYAGHRPRNHQYSGSHSFQLHYGHGRLLGGDSQPQGADDVAQPNDFAGAGFFGHQVG